MWIKQTFAAALALTAATAVGAGTTIQTNNQYGGQSSTDAVQIAHGKMRVDSGSGGGYVIFDSNERTITIVEPAEQSYMVMTAEDIQSMGDAVKRAMAQVEQQLQNMPPAQREQMRRMMEQQMGAMMGGQKPSAKPEIVSTGETRTVAGYECRVVRIMVEGTSKGSACMSDFADLGIPESDRETIKAMTEFSLELTRHFGDMMPGHMQAMAAEGYPVQYESTVGGTAISGSLESVETGELDPGLFQVPSGYSRKSMPTMPGG